MKRSNKRTVKFECQFYSESDGGPAEITSYRGLPPAALDIPSEIKGRQVVSIRDSAFENYSGLTSVTIPSGVTSIGFCAFRDCGGLTSVTIPARCKIYRDSFDDDCKVLRN